MIGSGALAQTTRRIGFGSYKNARPRTRRVPPGQAPSEPFDGLRPSGVKTMVVDEAHHCGSEGWESLIEVTAARRNAGEELLPEAI